MSVLRAILRSTKGRIVLACAAAYAAWHFWLSLAAGPKLSPAIAADRARVNVLVTLPFPPERFHVLVFQRYGRVSGTEGNSVEVRGVNRADLRALARPYWVERVDPLPTGG